jgi:hypothetical protein
MLKKMGWLPNLLPMSPIAKLRVKVFMRKENAMNATVIVLLLTILRLVIPFGLVLLLGELIRRRDANYRLKV